MASTQTDAESDERGRPRAQREFEDGARLGQRRLEGAHRRHDVGRPRGVDEVVHVPRDPVVPQDRPLRTCCATSPSQQRRRSPGSSRKARRAPSDSCPRTWRASANKEAGGSTSGAASSSATCINFMRGPTDRWLPSVCSGRAPRRQTPCAFDASERVSTSKCSTLTRSVEPEAQNGASAVQRAHSGPSNRSRRARWPFAVSSTSVGMPSIRQRPWRKKHAYSSNSASERRITVS